MIDQHYTTSKQYTKDLLTKSESEQSVLYDTVNQQPKILKIGNLTFASQKVLLEFLLTSLLIIIIPIGMVVILNDYVSTLQLTELQKVVYTVVPALLFINIIIGTYIYRSIKDPTNYQKDSPQWTKKDR